MREVNLLHCACRDLIRYTMRLLSVCSLLMQYIWVYVLRQKLLGPAKVFISSRICRFLYDCIIQMGALGYACTVLCPSLYETAVIEMGDYCSTGITISWAKASYRNLAYTRVYGMLLLDSPWSLPANVSCLYVRPRCAVHSGFQRSSIIYAIRCKTFNSLQISLCRCSLWELGSIRQSVEFTHIRFIQAATRHVCD